MVAITALLRNFLVTVVTDEEPLCLIRYSVDKTLLLLIFPTIDVHAMLHQCHFSYYSSMIACTIVASIHILRFSLLIIIIATNTIAISNLDADATAKNIF